MKNRVLNLFGAVGSHEANMCISSDLPNEHLAPHHYEVGMIDVDNDKYLKFAEINFQNGPLNEFGLNGCGNEALISIVIDRLEHFQAGQFSCRENALALTKLEEALHWLRSRTQRRMTQGVEGTRIATQQEGIKQ